MIVIIGYVATIAVVLGGFLLAGGHLAILWQPVEVLIIGGAALVAFAVSSGGKILKATMGALVKLLGGSPYNKEMYMETLTLLSNIFNKARRDGLMSIEDDIENPENSALFQKAPKVLKDHHAVEFITDYLRLMVSGNLDAHELDNLMDLEIETHHHEAMKPVDAVRKLADGLPAFGIVAAVLGVVHTMESVGLPPAELGKLIAAALVGTFLGILLAYGFVSPVANLLEVHVDESSKYFQTIKSGMIAFVNGSPPPTAVEFARKVAYSTERPSFLELEEHLRNAKGG
ncbi:MAG: flagellar motor stator protein MotA [Gammaproteobacteria bacterium]